MQTRDERTNGPRTLVCFGVTCTLVLSGCTAPVPEASEGGTVPGPGTSTTTAGPSSRTAGDPVLGEPATIASGLDVPWSIAFHAGTPLVSERDTGVILEVDEHGGTRTIGTLDDIEPAGEGGLLGLAVRGEDLYAYSTTASGNRVQRFPLEGVPGDLRLGPAKTLVEGMPSATFHNGGRIAFGPDGMLYVTVGDAGERGTAQDREVLAGKILRMTPDGEVPDDNPFPDSLVWSYGHRNPQGIAWAADGTMFASEFGQDTWDELNVIEAGKNYGWPVVEGRAEGEAGSEEFVDPVQQWAPAEASPSGIGILDGTIYVANLRGQRLRTVPVDDPAASAEYFVEEFGRLRDVTTTPDGRLWMLTNNSSESAGIGLADDEILEVPMG